MSAAVRVASSLAVPSPDGNSPSPPTTPGTWLSDVATGRMLHALGGPSTSVAFSPDGKLSVTAGDDGTARIWPTCDVCDASLAQLLALAKRRLAATA